MQNSNKVQIYVNELNCVALGCTFFLSFLMGTITQLVKVLAAKPGDPSSIPGNHMVKGEHQLLQVFL